MAIAARLGAIVGIVAGALFIASIGVAYWSADTSAADAQASAGMYAFSDALLFLGIFGPAAIAISALAVAARRKNKANAAHE
jgi:hypothetical protein